MAALRLRLCAVLIGVGGVLIFKGFQEFKVGRGTTAEPESIELLALEENPAVSNNHLKVGKHLALFSYGVFEYKQRSGGGEPDDATKVNHVYYPIISDSHPYLDQLARAAEEHGGLDKVPEAEWPVPQQLAVLVKSKKYKTIGDIPQAWEEVAEIQGLAVQDIEPLESDEQRLILENFPGVDLQRTIVLEEGRKPASGLQSVGMMAGGGAIAVFGVVWLFQGFRQGNSGQQTAKNDKETLTESEKK